MVMVVINVEFMFDIRRWLVHSIDCSTTVVLSCCATSRCIAQAGDSVAIIYHRQLVGIMSYYEHCAHTKYKMSAMELEFLLDNHVLGGISVLLCGNVCVWEKPGHRRCSLFKCFLFLKRFLLSTYAAEGVPALTCAGTILHSIDFVSNEKKTALVILIFNYSTVSYFSWSIN